MQPGAAAAIVCDWIGRGVSAPQSKEWINSPVAYFCDRFPPFPRNRRVGRASISKQRHAAQQPAEKVVFGALVEGVQKSVHGEVGVLFSQRASLSLSGE